MYFINISLQEFNSFEFKNIYSIEKWNVNKLYLWIKYQFSIRSSTVRLNIWNEKDIQEAVFWCEGNGYKNPLNVEWMTQEWYWDKSYQRAIVHVLWIYIILFGMFWNIGDVHMTQCRKYMQYDIQSRYFVEQE